MQGLGLDGLAVPLHMGFDALPVAGYDLGLDEPSGQAAPAATAAEVATRAANAAPVLGEAELQAAVGALPRHAAALGPDRAATGFVGDLRRSAAHMQWLRLWKKVRQQGKRQREASRDFVALSRCWNMQVLRAGDKVKPEGCNSGSTTGHATSRAHHPNQWDARATVVVACRALGIGGKSRRAGIAGTTHGLAALSSVAAIALAGIRRRVAAYVAAVARPAAPCAGVVISVGYDASPHRVRFGAQQAKLAPLARCLLKQGDRWRAVAYAEFMSSRSSKCCARFGVLEVMALKCSVHMSLDPFSLVAKKLSLNLICLPMIVQAANASCIFGCIQQALPELTIEKLHVMCFAQKFILVGECPDAAKANVRAQLELIERLPDRCLHSRAACAAHQVHLTITSASEEKRIVGDVHAIAVVTAATSTQTRLQAALWLLIDKEFQWFHTPPDPRNLAHAEAVLSQTFIRTHELVRSQAGRTTAQSSLRAVRAQQLRGAQKKKLLTFANGDWRVAQCHHHEQGCCGSLQEAKQNFFAACCETGLLLSSNTTVPSASRWGTCTEVCAKAVGSIMCHGILQRALAVAFPRWNFDELPNAANVPEEADDQGDFRALLRQKVWRARKVLAEERALQNLSLVSWCAVPLDHLNQQLQCDDGKDLLFAICCAPTSSPLGHAEGHVLRMLRDPVAVPDLAPVFHHFGDTPAEHGQLLQRARGMLLSIASQLAWRFARYSTWPFRLLRMVHPQGVDPMPTATAFWGTPPCCKTPGFCLKLMKEFSGPSELARDTPLREVLLTWGRVGRATNMDVERKFASMKQAGGSAKQAPDAERLCASGVVSEMLSTHIGAGGHDPRCTTRNQLLSMDAPVTSRKKKKNLAAQTGGSGGYLLFQGEQRRAHPGQNSKQHAAEAAAAWRRLDHATKQAYHARARSRGAERRAGDAHLSCATF